MYMIVFDVMILTIMVKSISCDRYNCKDTFNLNLEFSNYEVDNSK